MGWYKKGSEAKEALEKAEKLTQMLKEKNIPRIRLKAGEEAPIIFIDDEAFWCEIHIVKIGDRFVELTCSSGISPCPICLKEGKRPLGVTFFTILDLRKYTKKDGTVVKYTKMLLPARRTLAKQIFDYKEKFGTLKGMKVILKRYNDTDPACGIIIDIDRDAKGRIRRYDLSKLGKEYTVPFNYEKVLAPPTKEELEALGYVTSIVGDTPITDDEEELLPEVEDNEKEKIEEGIEEDIEEVIEENEEDIEEEIEEGEEDIEEVIEENEEDNDIEKELDKLEEEVDEEKPKKRVRKRGRKNRS